MIEQYPDDDDTGLPAAVAILALAFFVGVVVGRYVLPHWHG